MVSMLGTVVDRLSSTPGRRSDKSRRKTGVIKADAEGTLYCCSLSRTFDRTIKALLPFLRKRASARRHRSVPHRPDPGPGPTW